MGLGGQDGAERIYGAIVSGNYFTVLGTRPHAGRLLMDADDEGAPGSHPVMVLSYELWQRRFGGNADVVGQTVPLNGHPFTIVGVAPRGLPGDDGAEQRRVGADLSDRRSRRRAGAPRCCSSREAVWLLMGGRLKPGVTVAQANAELSSIGAGASSANSPTRIAARG